MPRKENILYVLLYESCAASALVAQVGALVGAKKKKSLNEPEEPSKCHRHYTE
jgi:hypothetical protein